MINVKSIFRLVRSKNNDINEVKFSDYDIVDALNEAIRYLNASYAMKNSDFLERIRTYKGKEPDRPYIDLAENGVDLPKDFITLQDIRQIHSGDCMHPIPAVDDIKRTDEYKVVGGKIYAGADFKILYRARITEVSYNDIGSSEASVDLPDFFFDGLVQMTGMILNNTDADVMAQATDQIISRIVPRRRYKNVEVPMPFIV